MLLNIIFHLSILHAALFKHEVTSPQFREFEYSEVCDFMGSKNSLLISPKTLTQIECFNKNYSLLDFCQKKFPQDKTLTRGFIDGAKKKVLCEMSGSVLVSVICDKRDYKYCLVPKKGCEELRLIYANRLESVHESLIERKLNCYFSKILGESSDEI